MTDSWLVWDTTWLTAEFVRCLIRTWAEHKCAINAQKCQHSHTCCMRNCTGSTSQNVSTTNWESQCIAVCSTRLLSTWSTAVYQSPTFPADVIYGQPLDITWPYHVTSSALSVVGPSPSPVRRSGTRYPTVSTTGAHQQQLQTIAENEPVSLLPLSAHSAV